MKQVIWSKFPKSFRGAGDLVVFYNFFSDFSGFFLSDFNKITKHHQVTSSPKALRKLADVLNKFSEKFMVLFLYCPSPSFVTQWNLDLGQNVTENLVYIVNVSWNSYVIRTCFQLYVELKRCSDHHLAFPYDSIPIIGYT